MWSLAILAILREVPRLLSGDPGPGGGERRGRLPGSGVTVNRCRSYRSYISENKEWK